MQRFTTIHPWTSWIWATIDSNAQSDFERSSCYCGFLHTLTRQQRLSVPAAEPLFAMSE